MPPIDPRLSDYASTRTIFAGLFGTMRNLAREVRELRNFLTIKIEFAVFIADWV